MIVRSFRSTVHGAVLLVPLVLILVTAARPVAAAQATKKAGAFERLSSSHQRPLPIFTPGQISVLGKSMGEFPHTWAHHYPSTIIISERLINAYVRNLQWIDPLGISWWAHAAFVNSWADCIVRQKTVYDALVENAFARKPQKNDQDSREAVNEILAGKTKFVLPGDIAHVTTPLPNKKLNPSLLAQFIKEFPSTIFYGNSTSDPKHNVLGPLTADHILGTDQRLKDELVEIGNDKVKVIGESYRPRGLTEGSQNFLFHLDEVAKALMEQYGIDLRNANNTAIGRSNGGNILTDAIARLHAAHPGFFKHAIFLGVPVDGGNEGFTDVLNQIRMMGLFYNMPMGEAFDRAIRLTQGKNIHTHWDWLRTQGYDPSEIHRIMRVMGAASVYAAPGIIGNDVDEKDIDFASRQKGDTDGLITVENALSGGNPRTKFVLTRNLGHGGEVNKSFGLKAARIARQKGTFGRMLVIDKEELRNHNY